MVEAPNVRGKLFLSAPLCLRVCRAWSAVAFIAAALSFSACRKKPHAEKKPPVSQHHSQRIAALAAAEINRDSRVVTVDDLMSRDVEVRRRAMQALARVADQTARPALERGLSDEDGQVVAWAAFGLGRACDKDSDLAVAQLALRAATWFAAEHAPTVVDRFTIQPISAIADALGRCGTTLAESTLRTWLHLDKSLAQCAALALGTIAGKQHRLENTTLVALLEAADSKDHLTTALFPLTRLAAVETNVQKRLLSVATRALSSKTDAQRYGIRALPLAGENAAPILERTLCDNANYDPELRADAARGLSRLGDPGQQSLGHALVRLLPRSSSLNPTWLTSSDFGPISEILDSLNYGDAELRPLLENLAKINVQETNSAAVQRRLLTLRCQAASILAGSTVTAPLLLACDPNKDGRQGALAISRVLGRAPIRGRRAQLYDRLAHSPDLVVRESALRWLRSHPEVRESARILTDALGAEYPGVVATAAGIVAEHPERAQNLPQPSKVQSSSPDDSHDHETSDRAPHPTPELLLALAQATHRAWQADAVDVRVQLADAVATLGALSEKPYLEELCQSKSGVLRKHAELALRHFGEAKRQCVVTKVVSENAAPQDNEDPVHLRFHSEIGSLDLWLEPQIAPIAVARLVELTKGGYFDNMSVHRVVSGFVVQLGDRVGDGYGVAGREPLRDELAPLSFGAGDVGLALSGPDTGSSQFFVVLGPHPHLDGDYTRVGRVDAGWDRLVVGDVIQRVELLF